MINYMLDTIMWVMLSRQSLSMVFYSGKQKQIIIKNQSMISVLYSGQALSVRSKKETKNRKRFKLKMLNLFIKL